MMGNIIFNIFLTLASVGFLTQYFITRKRHKNNFRQYLEPVLERNNLKFVSSKFPGWFKVGPFPKVEGNIGRPQNNIPFIGRGEYSQYRIVEVENPTGKCFKVWALLDFELFKLKKIRWRVFPGDPVPQEGKVFWNDK